MMETPFANGGRTHAPRPCLIVYHVPKCAGESLRAWLKQHAELRVWRWYRELPKHSLTPNETANLHRADVVIGHFSPAPSRYGGPYNTTPGPWPTLRSFLSHHRFSRTCIEWTVLREPVDRAASPLFYLNYRADAAHVSESQLRVLVDCFNTTKPRFDGVGCGEKNLPYHRQPWLLARTPLGRMPDYNNDICRIFGRPPHWNRFDSAYAGYRGGAGENEHACDLPRALAHLRRLDGIGFVHSLNATLAEWTTALGLDDSSSRGRGGTAGHKSPRGGAPQLTHTNPSSHARVSSAALPPQLLAAIRESNSDDSRLWKSLVSHCAKACGGEVGLCHAAKRDRHHHRPCRPLVRPRGAPCSNGLTPRCWPRC